MLETPNLEDKTPLMQATERADLHVVQFLCTLGAKTNTQSLIGHRTALMIALFYAFIDIAQYLLEKNANIHLRDINDRTALHYAIDGDNLDAVKFALKHRAEINARDDKGWTPLLRAGNQMKHEIFSYVWCFIRMHLLQLFWKYKTTS